MILELSIKNVALISELSFQPDDGLSVLTGETGAGKSILLGALSLILGERASSDLIRAHCETASVEGLFDSRLLKTLPAILVEHGLPACEDDTLILKREFFRNGRGKCLVNGSFTTLSVLAKIGEQLVDIHGQHDHQSLLKKELQRQLLDNWAGLQDIKQSVQVAYDKLKQSKTAREQLALDEAERVRRIDLLQFQVQEIEAAQIQPGEHATLLEERTKLGHAERLVGTATESLELLHRREEGAVRDGLAQSADALAGLTNYDSQMGNLADQLRSAEALVEDVVEHLSDFIDTFEADPARLEWVEERLDTLTKLERKYGETEEDILKFMAQASGELEQLNHQDETLEQLAAEEKKLTIALSDYARRLTASRNRAGKLLSERMAVELKALGFNQSYFEVNISQKADEQGWIEWDGATYKCGPHGADDVDFLIAPNPGETAKPVAKTASGGELSRIMLAIKVIASLASDVPTMIFDEVDAGVGGATADAVGKKLQQLSKKRQVIVITHLPQIARFGKKHFLVKKDVDHGKTTTSVEPLDKDRQIEELARLLAGDNVTDTALKHAKELKNQT